MSCIMLTKRALWSQNIWCKRILPSRGGDLTWETLRYLWTSVLLSSILFAINPNLTHMEFIVLNLESLAKHSVWASRPREYVQHELGNLGGVCAQRAHSGCTTRT